MTQPTQAAIEKNLNDSLAKTLAQKGALAEQVEATDKQLSAIRNALEGVGLGKRIAAEAAAAEAAAKAKADEEIPSLDD